MSEKNNGGPAFPCDYLVDEDGVSLATGMNLRDYFAAKAMQGLIQSCEVHSNKGILYSPNIVANNAYVIADAMLKARG